MSKFNQIGTYTIILAFSMVSGVILGVVLAMPFMIAASGAGHLDLSSLFVLGFTAIFVKLFSVKLSDNHLGYFQIVLIPALVWVALGILVTQRLLTGWHLSNAIASLTIVSIFYACGAWLRRSS